MFLRLHVISTIKIDFLGTNLERKELYNVSLHLWSGCALYRHRLLLHEHTASNEKSKFSGIIIMLLFINDVQEKHESVVILDCHTLPTLSSTLSQFPCIFFSYRY